MFYVAADVRLWLSMLFTAPGNLVGLVRVRACSFPFGSVGFARRCQTFCIIRRHCSLALLLMCCFRLDSYALHTTRLAGEADLSGVVDSLMDCFV